MHEHLWNHAKEEVLDEAKRESKVAPVVAPLQDFEHVAIALDVAVEVHLVERLHGYFGLSMVLLAVLFLFEGQIMLDRLARQPSLLILAGCKFGGDDPKCGQNRQIDYQSEEDPRLEASAELPADVAGDKREC